MRFVAIGLALVAVALAVIATIVVLGRRAPPPTTAPVTRTVSALDVAELERDVVESASERGQVFGVKVTDAGVRGTLGLAPSDVITGISGRPIRRQFDLHDALAGAAAMKATALYVELVRDGAPHVERWELDGDLRDARRNKPSRAASVTPSLRPVRDPLLDTIKEIDDHHFTVPRATIEQLAASPTVFAQGARVFPAMKLGRPEGLRLFIVRPTSALWALGLRSGDTVQSVNGVTLVDPALLRDVYDQVKGTPLIRIAVRRRNALEVIEITQTP